MTPDYEVRLQLDPARVLNSEHELVSAVLESLKVSATPLQMNVQFLDNCSKDIYDAGWCVRIRKVEGKSHHELTYKKRYDINNGNIDEVLNRAEKDGFGSKYEAQVEWGYSKQTLSISREKKVSYSGKTELELPGLNESRKMAIKEEPDKFDDWGPGHDWGTKILAKARVFGPVLAKRWIGKWNDVQVYIEVWPIPNAEGTGTEYIVEASFKTDSYKTASTERNNLTNQLQAQGWALTEDSLKTKLILERYSCSNMAAENGD
ncbi:hypothetical protein TrVFT333_002334 [Trichoderma virens FT-333]|nr:hypothetical protein TrVFT333_002334 [Trichoderma virens FT-333]